MDTKEYVKGKEATRILGVHQQTLYQWDRKGWIETIRTPGGKRLYNVKKYITESRFWYRLYKRSRRIRFNRRKVKYKLRKSILSITERRFRETKEVNTRQLSEPQNNIRYRKWIKFQKTRIKKDNKISDLWKDKWISNSI